MVIYMLLHTLDKLEKHSPVVKSVHFRINNPGLTLTDAAVLYFLCFLNSSLPKEKYEHP